MTAQNAREECGSPGGREVKRRVSQALATIGRVIPNGQDVFEDGLMTAALGERVVFDMSEMAEATIGHAVALVAQRLNKSIGDFCRVCLRELDE
jgi:hypothetical protein